MGIPCLFQYISSVRTLPGGMPAAGLSQQPGVTGVNVIQEIIKKKKKKKLGKE